jgi:hypothetical protein
MSKVKNTETNKTPNINDPEWSDHVIGLLLDDEKIKGNPTTDGLRRIFEVALNCVIIDSSSDVVQSPDPNNEKRATVVHSLTYILNDEALTPETKLRHVNGAADVYWGNCDKIYRNHPVAVAETRAEGRALRRGLRLKKVVAAEELAENIEDDVMGDNVSRISDNQINFMDVLSQRLNINMIEMFGLLGFDKNIKALKHYHGETILRELSKYQQSVDSIPENILGYNENWKP